MTYILYNPHANGGRAAEGVASVKEALTAEAPELLDITALDAAAFLTGLPAEDRVVLCGGDGTIHRLVNALGGSVPDAELCLWRFGTGNDFLRDIDPGNGQRRIRINDYIRNLPVAQFGGEKRRYLNGCSLGVDAVVCQKVEENLSAPHKSYATTALGCFFRNYKPIRGRVTVDGETREYDRIWMACAMHGRYQGGGMKFAPDQDRTGDTLTSLVWHGTSALGTLLSFPFVIPGKHTHFSACDMRVGREITVEFEQPTVIQLDGEVVDGVSAYTIRK